MTVIGGHAFNERPSFSGGSHLAPRTSHDTAHVIDLTDRTTARSSNREPLMDIKQVAERLGVEVRHVRRLVHERRIPFIKWGHLLRFDPVEIDAWIDANRQQPARR